MDKNKWHFRNNIKRKFGKRNRGKHPSLIIGETKDGKSYINIGLTSSKKRGHHKNIEIHNPQDWNKTSYLRDDIRIDLKEYLSEVLKDYKLCPNDIEKIANIIKKNSH